MNSIPAEFSQRILAWHDKHGRKHLPWQQTISAYRVWISEIMLQQTQVATVIPYFHRFLQHYPTLSALAQATEDEVLHLWTGLGYYSRARNILKSAKLIQEKFDGELPRSIEDLITLPGIGRSTAGAILAIAYELPATILDGNVKRVLARFEGIEEAINQSATTKKLWGLATSYTPVTQVRAYTQAMMDMGATVCTRTKPLCTACPLQTKCVAYLTGKVQLLPLKNTKSLKPTRIATFLIIRNKQHFLLEKRKGLGVWEGLWSFPQIAEIATPANIKNFCTQQSLQILNIQELPKFRHTFSHYHLQILPVVIDIQVANQGSLKCMEDDRHIWYNPNELQKIGLPTPIKKILEEL